MSVKTIAFSQQIKSPSPEAMFAVRSSLRFAASVAFQHFVVLRMSACEPLENANPCHNIVRFHYLCKQKRSGRSVCESIVVLLICKPYNNNTTPNALVLLLLQ